MIGWLFKSVPKSRITLFNTKGREMQNFEPLSRGVMKLYTCGPTVYNFIHIGNLRAFLLSDIVRRTFEYAGYKVTQVMNLTDFGHLVGDAEDTEDKMSVALKREELEPTMENMYAVATKYANAFKEDMAALNIKMPHAMPRASEHVKGQMAYIETLMHKGFAYKTSDGIYFDTVKFPNYGVLGGVASSEHSRTGVNPEKHDPKDFALWKFSSDMGWDAPWGKGFPGWHIECTAMATQYLGKSFDLHTGGVDLAPTHHNNEIAQAEAVNNRSYVSYWLHNEFVNLDGTKISKSLGNDINLRQLVDREIHPLAYRYWLLTGHYRQKVNFTWDAVTGAQTALLRARKIFSDLRGTGTVHTEYKKKFEAAVYVDFDTPGAVALLWELLKDQSVPAGDKRATVLDFDRVLGLGFGQKESVPAKKVVVTDEIPEAVRALMREREEARKSKDFARADAIRDALKEQGFAVEDGPNGAILTRH